MVEQNELQLEADLTDLVEQNELLQNDIIDLELESEATASEESEVDNTIAKEEQMA